MYCILTIVIEEAYSWALEGHKGVTKTYNRICQKFFWENMKVDVHKYIQDCLQCQIKKLVRVKTENPMVITDTDRLLCFHLANTTKPRILKEIIKYVYQNANGCR